MFKKTLAKYYQKWYQDCLNSAELCKKEGRYDAAAEYLKSAKEYKQIIDENSEAIKFFSQGDNAHLIDRAIPKEFRNYK